MSRSLMNVRVVMQETPFRQHVTAHGGGCNCVAIAPTGLLTATCGHDGIVRLWTTYDGALSSELKGSSGMHAPGMNSVAFSEDKGAVLGACNDKSIKMWDMHTGRLKFTLTGVHS
jgi:WD40 repeat protein